VKRQGQLNALIIFENVLMLFNQNYKNQSMLDKTTACQKLVGWCLTALSAQKGYIMPCKN